ncbi:MAG: hypothetical protein ACXVH1_24130 [Solirubrobacteraceae bacterium]
MRAVDMEPGRDYRLTGDRERVVTVLDTPADVRRRARVLVRFVNGVKAGEVVELPSRRIAAPVDGPAPSTPPVRRPRIVRFERAPLVGEEVHWKQTGEIVWKVDSIDGDAAVMTGELFGKATTKTVPLGELEVRPVMITPAEPLLPPRRTGVPRTRADREAGRDEVAPDRPRRELDQFLDDIIFSPRCLDAYSRRFAPGVRGAAINDRLRDEIRHRGYVVRRGDQGAGEFARIRVDRRFDIVLHEQPTAEHPVSVDGLWFPRKPGSPGKSRRGRR